MAIQLSESLLELKRFVRPKIMAKYLALCHSKQYELGEVTRSVYNHLKEKSQANSRVVSASAPDFLFEQAAIDEAVDLVDKRLNGLTAACGPAHRSFPLAFCPWIEKDDLFELSVQEAALTHASPIAGQVAGIINLICRALVTDQTWDEAIDFAFATPGLHDDVADILIRYCRYSGLDAGAHPAYAPAALNAALYYVANSTSATDAIQKAASREKFYCVNIVGILAGVRWGIPVQMYKSSGQASQIKVLRDTASRMARMWTGVSGTPTA